MKRDDRFDEDDVETDETRRLSGSLPKSAEKDTPHQQSQATGVLNRSTLDALKELEAARLSSRAGIVVSINPLRCVQCHYSLQLSEILSVVAHIAYTPPTMIVYIPLIL